MINYETPVLDVEKCIGANIELDCKRFFLYSYVNNPYKLYDSELINWQKNVLN